MSLEDATTCIGPGTMRASRLIRLNDQKTAAMRAVATIILVSINLLDYLSRLQVYDAEVVN